MDRENSDKLPVGNNQNYVEDLIGFYEFTLRYPETIPSAYCHHSYFITADIRTEIHENGLDHMVRELDIKLLRGLKRFGAPAYMEKDRNKPLAYWWWHLDKIARREYPEELLPEYLREVYKDLCDDNRR